MKEEVSYLVEMLKLGKTAAFRDLYELFARKIYYVCRKMNLDHEDAEGVVQDLFLKIWQNRTNLNSALSFNAYLLTITKSMVIKLVREKTYRLAYQKHASAHQLLAVNDTEDYIVFTNLEELSSQALDQLPVKQKQIFMMKNVEHYTVEEIAKNLNLSRRTVENHIYRATKSLKEKLANIEALPLQ